LALLIHQIDQVNKKAHIDIPSDKKIAHVRYQWLRWEFGSDRIGVEMYGSVSDKDE
jgi:hypothetical protein